jgi:hypothetical protein
MARRYPKSLRQPKAKPAVGDDVIGVATVNGVPVELRCVAQVFLVGATVPAYAAGRPEPRYSNAIPRCNSGYTFPHADYGAYDLVPRNDRRPRMRQLAVDHMEIGAAHAAGADFDYDLARGGMGIVEVRVFECRPRGAQHHRMHAGIPFRTCCRGQ